MQLEFTCNYRLFLQSNIRNQQLQLQLQFQFLEKSKGNLFGTVFFYKMSTHPAVVVTLRFKPGCLESGLNALKACQDITRTEVGCEAYDVWVDKSTAELPEDQRLYYLLERWTDQHSLDVHLAKEHVATLRAALKESCAAVQASHCRFVQ
jgi:quinol monooxygenase YgiN